MENNKLIAEFMDVNLIEGQLGDYHTSWEWLMPVLKKIVNEKMNVNCSGLWRKIIYPYNYDIEDVHNQVVEFIKQLNKE